MEKFCFLPKRLYQRMWLRVISMHDVLVLAHLSLALISLSALYSCHEEEIITPPGGEPTQEDTIVFPEKLVLQEDTLLSIPLRGTTIIDFSIHPKGVVCSLDNGRDEISLVPIVQAGDSIVQDGVCSENVRLKSVEPVSDGDAQQSMNGRYRAILEDAGLHHRYQETFSLVLTYCKGTEDERRIASPSFSVKADASVMIETGLPVVQIETEDERPIIRREEWEDGAEMTIRLSNGKIDYHGTVSIKGRGNTTWGFPKKPYALKLGNREGLLGMPEHKRWCLLANWADRSLIRNATAFELARQTEQDWTPSGQYVELVLNGEHLGNYYLCEKIGIDRNRLNLDNPKDKVVDRGYLLELDTNFDEENKFYSPIKHLPYQFKDPSSVSIEQQNYIMKYVAEMEDALYDSARFASRDFSKYMDLESFADYWLVYEIAQLWEPNHPKSVYLHKDAGGKMKAGPVWDFDLGCFKPRDSYFYVNKTAVYYDQLFHDREFCLLLRARLNAYKDKFLSVGTYIDSLGECLYHSQRINYSMWPISTVSSGDETIDDYDEVMARIKRAIAEKSEWLDKEL